MKDLIVGTWRLIDYKMVRSDQIEFHDDILGLLIYSPEGYFSLMFNYPESPKEPYQKELIKKYFFGGKYSVTESKISEENFIHVIDSKINERRDVDYFLKDKILTRISCFGESVLTTRWRRG